MNAPLALNPVESIPLGPGQAVVTFDIQPTETTAALFDRDGIMRGLAHSPPPTPTPTATRGEATLNQVEDLTTQLARDFPEVVPTAIGLIAPGIIDDREGIAILSGDLEWADVPYKQLVEDRLHLPCSFSHDARAAAEAEFQLGAARSFDNVVMLRLGARIAGSLYVDGRVHDGGGFAGGLGHAIVDPAGTRCMCGAYGCLQTVASTSAILERYSELDNAPPATGDEVLERARRGDAAANQVWSNALDAVALVVSQVSAILAPEAVIVGGGLALTGDEFFPAVRHRMNTLLGVHRRPLVIPSLITLNAGHLGAALHARALPA